MKTINPSKMRWTDGWFWGSVSVSVFVILGLITKNNNFIIFSFVGSLGVALIIVLITALFDKKYREGKK